MRTFTYLFIPAAESTSGSPSKNKVYQFQVLPFGLNTAPQVFTRLGHTVTGYLHRQGISVIAYLDDWLIHHPDHKVLLRHQAQLMNTLDLVGFVLNRKKSELALTQDIQFLGIRLRLDLGEASLPESKAWEIVARARHLSSLHVLSYIQVSQLIGSLSWASGLIPLGRLYLRPLQRHFHSLGLTDRFTPPRRSDPLVLANLLRRWQDPCFLTSGIPLRMFQAEFTIFTDASTQGWGAHMGDSQISGTWTHTDCKLHINCLELLCRRGAGGRRRGTRSRAPRPTRGKGPAWSGGAPEGDRVLKRYFMPYSTGLKCSRATRL